MYGMGLRNCPKSPCFETQRRWPVCTDQKSDSVTVFVINAGMGASPE